MKIQIISEPRNVAGWKHQVGSYLDTFFSNADREKKGYNRDAMVQLDNYFIEQGLSEPQRQALLYNILIESGGAKVLGAHGNGYYGLVGWSPERYGQIKDKSLLGQAAYLVDTLKNGDGSMSWNHGGKGSGYESWRNAKSAFWDKNSDYNAANNALVYGYIRPYDKVGRINGGKNYFVKHQSGGVDLDAYIRQNSVSQGVDLNQILDRQYLPDDIPLTYSANPERWGSQLDKNYNAKGKYNDRYSFYNDLRGSIYRYLRNQSVSDDAINGVLENIVKQHALETGNGKHVYADYNYGNVTLGGRQRRERDRADSSHVYRGYNSMDEYIADYFNRTVAGRELMDSLRKGDGRYNNLYDFVSMMKRNKYFEADMENYYNGLAGIRTKRLEGRFIDTPSVSQALQDTQYDVTRGLRNSDLFGSIANTVNDAFSMANSFIPYDEFEKSKCGGNIKHQTGSNMNGTPIIAEHGEDILYPDGTVLKSVGTYHEFGDDRKYRPDGSIDGNPHTITGNPNIDFRNNPNLVKIGKKHRKTYYGKDGKPFVFPSTMNQWGYMNEAVGNYFPQAHRKNNQLF